ncbi:MAG: isoleucine--tRNA ligase [Planctomycetes bacterium]|nr:isoleucine--tRNA ligase [Planctomycetota bacterium]
MPAFKPVDVTEAFPAMESRVLAFWKEKDVFKQSLELREGAATWVFFEGPPTANGKPHPGHALTRVVKDLFPRYKTMRGFHVPRKAGWDTHGLPVEIEVEKELKISGKQDIEKFGVEPFVRKCMDSVFRYTNDWEEFTERLGFWLDLKDAYVTYHKPYVESVWWSLKQLHEKNLLYQGHKILPWCPRCGTALSSHEVGLGYKEVEDPSVFVTFRTAGDSKVSFLAWTTTPWTLPSNAGLAVKADTEYSHVKVGDETLIMASVLVEKVMGKIPHEVVKTEMGLALVGRRYRPLFDWWNGRDAEVAGAWKVCAADFVTLDTGSGIVHVAPAFGADDYSLGQKEGLPVIQLVDAAGKFTPECGAFAGRFVKDADNDIVKDLRGRGLLLKRESYKHDYPFCWRCNSPLIYFARAGWFIRTTREIKRVIENNKTIQWLPEHIRDGRFGNFLETNIDWALSRERYWGTPLPVWVCQGCKHEQAIGSFDELKAQKNPRGLDAFDRAKAKDPTLNDHLRVHKPWIDEAQFDCSKCGGNMKRVSEVIDCWYDSGAMPFAQWGYPHAAGSMDKFEKAFPADFISEAIDQTRGWFYSLLAESTLLFEGARHPHPFKACVVLGHVCDEKGEKMSKSKGNYIDPMLILREEGADALRWFFYSSTNPWTSARFSRPNVRESQKEFLIKLRNVYSFFTIYANIDGFDPSADLPEEDPEQTSVIEKYHRGGRPLESRALMDRWILSELHQSVNMVRQRLDDYDIYGAAGYLNALAESLSNWYVQRTRERYWRSWQTPDRSSPEDVEKLDAYWTLFECLATIARLAAPFVPFSSEEMWQNLVVGPMEGKGVVPESVHLADYPVTDPHAVDRELADEVALVREVVSLGRNVRAAQKRKVRVPLAKLVLVLADQALIDVAKKHEDVVKDALNVKKVEYARVADQYVTYELKPNFKLIGAKYRELVPGIKKTLSTANAAHLKNKIANDGFCALSIDGKEVELTQEEVEVTIAAKPGYAAAGSRQVVVVLDTTLTPELIEEGLARELVSRIQKLRGDLELKYEQRVKLALNGSEKLQAVAEKFGEYIKGETLATELVFGAAPAGWKTSEEELKEEGERFTIALHET